MKHKNTPRGGAGLDPEIEEAMLEREQEQPRCKESRATPEKYVVRWICICCNNLLKEDPQVPPLPAQTLRAIGVCCKDALPEHIQHRAMPVRGCDDPKPGQFDQRAEPRPEDDPGAKMGKEKT